MKPTSSADFSVRLHAVSSRQTESCLIWILDI